MDVQQSGEYTFIFDDPSTLIAVTHVALFDRYTGRGVNLNETHTYSFSVNINEPATYGSNRFAILVGEEQLTAVTENHKQNNTGISAEEASGILTLRGVGYEGNSIVRILDISGRAIAVQEQSGNAGMLALVVSVQAPGVYFIMTIGIMSGKHRLNPKGWYNPRRPCLHSTISPLQGSGPSRIYPIL